MVGKWMGMNQPKAEKKHASRMVFENERPILLDLCIPASLHPRNIKTKGRKKNQNRDLQSHRFFFVVVEAE